MMEHITFFPRSTSPNPAATHSHLLQRKCACGGTPGPSGMCQECQKKRLAHQGSTLLPEAQMTPFGHAVLHEPASNPISLMKKGSSPVHHDSAQDEPETAEPLGEETRAAFPDEQTPIGAPSLAGQEAETLDTKDEKTKCPTKTVVEKTIDMTPDGIKKGYRTGYGIVSVIRVEPTTTNWDGTKIVESNKLTKSSCPEEFGISPCTGADTFTVGAEGNSSILGKLSATTNRFYDFHITRWNKGSLLHDRNPKNIDTCEAACQQKYSCAGNVIGTHTVTRKFTKGTSGSRDVTLVNVTKS